jgi:anti-sigma factor RsiW
MTCERIRKSVFLHAHGQLRGLEPLVVEQHLARCPECRALREEWAAEKGQWTAALGSEAGLNGRGDALRQSIADQIRAPENRRRVSGRTPLDPRRRLALVAIGAALALALSAAAAFGPDAARGIRHFWGGITRKLIDCSQVEAPQRTPAGGQDAPAPDSPAGKR